MPSIVIAPELPMLLEELRGILTVEREDATISCQCPLGLPCGGIDVDKLDLTHRLLHQHVYFMGHKFIERMAIRGYDFVGPLRLHGPWRSYNFAETMTDVDSTIWAEAEAEDDPSKVLGFVGERCKVALPALMDYLLVGPFLHRAILVERIMPDVQEDDNAAFSNSSTP